MSAEPQAPGQLLADLNPVQHQAVTLAGGPLLILAGAGSGKTRVLTRRVAWLIHERGISPRRILAVTFTNKAAGEMRERVEALLGIPARDLWIGTFHSICLRWLRRHAREAGYSPGLSIFDSEDQRTLLRQLLKADGFDHSPRRVRDLLALISHAKNRGQRVADFQADAHTPAQQVTARFYSAYQAALHAQNAVDFDDLLLGTLRLFQDHPAICASYAEQFVHVLVDEYQDTNHVQFRIVALLAQHHRNIFAVGDDDQSIYGWRGADIRNILDFKEHFPDAQVLYLEQNYRSTRPILELANAVIAHNHGRWPKALWTERSAGVRPQFLLAGDEDDEAETIAARVSAAVAAGERRCRDVAIFYRTHAQSRPLEDAFLRSRVPYRLVGGVYFYERREVKDLLGYLRVLCNPQDEVNLRRALAVPRRGVGERSLDILLAESRARGIDPLQCAAEKDVALSAAAREALAEFGGFMLALRARLAEPPQVILAAIVDHIGFESYLETLGTDWEERVANVHELLEGARLFGSRRPEGGVREYLDEISLLTSIDTADTSRDAVTMMTAHNAKGLEFPCVFVTGLEEGLFPHASARDDEGELEEERRLFYVACTRAMDELVLSASQMRYRHGAAFGGVSRFLDEIPAALIDRIAIGDEADAPRARWGRRTPAGGWASGGRGRSVARDGGRDEDEPEAERGEHPLVGRRVFHATFGAGIVVAAQGEGARARIRVRFQDGRVRNVVHSYLEWEG